MRALQRKLTTIASFLVALLVVVQGQESATISEQECASEQECKDGDNVLNVPIDKKFFNENVANQDSIKPLDISTSFRDLLGSASVEKPEPGFMASVAESVLGIIQSKDSPTVENMLATARNLTSSSDKVRSFQETTELVVDTFSQVLDAMKRSFDSVDLHKLNPLSVYYYLEREDEHKNPSWKRRKHRYHKSLKTKTAIELHDALYLSELSYVDNIDDVQAGLKSFMNNTWELVYCSTKGFPKEPAHFIAIQKEPKEKTGVFPWQKDNGLDVMMAVRGTKEFGDLLSDGLLDAVDYRGGKAHAGIAEAGMFLVQKHIDSFKDILKVSGREKMRLWLTGHSLGAAAAAIAAIEFNDYPMIEASSIGFGCPALLSLDLSESTKDFITTVVADSDIVPRMSGVTMRNMLLDIMSFDWTKRALEDLEDFLVFLNNAVPLIDIPIREILSMAEENMKKYDLPAMSRVTTERMSTVLFPPGTCIHVYRDGVTYSATYTPCDFFDSADVTRTLLDDHMTLPGYHRAMIGMVREKLRDFKFDFAHDLMALPT